MSDRSLTLQSALRSLLAQRGAALDISQPTLSRALAALAGEVAVLGAGRATRYAWPQTVLGRTGLQPLHWVHEDGRVERLGSLQFIAGARLHVAAPGIDLLTEGALPWLLSPLRGEGFIGRMLAQALSAFGLDRDPGRWPLEHQLFAALQSGDAPGAIVLGEPVAPALPILQGDADLDALADAASRGALAGSSAAGEQPKFLARRSDGWPALVKFSPPRATPFGVRWHDLLQAEALALAVLAEHGAPVAQAELVVTARRSYLVSRRFDRVGRDGRRHAVPLHALHDAFVHGPRQHWTASVEALAAQRRLPAEAVPQVRAIQQFGHLSLMVARDDAARGRFTLAPIYDMLPMRWRPDPATGEMGLLPFTPEPVDLQSAARPVATQFWHRAAGLPGSSAEWRALAQAMHQRLR
jgi:hypothetical protein